MMIKVATFIFLSFLIHSHSWAITPYEVMDRVEKRYNVSDIQADFVQETFLKTMNITETASGHVYFKRPYMIRWHYQNPEEQFIISDGHTLWLYQPRERQVMVGRSESYFGNKKGISLFMDFNELRKGFIFNWAASEYEKKGVSNKDYYLIRLTPKTQQPDMVSLILYISRVTFDVMKSVTQSRLGDITTISFYNFRFNQGLKKDFFVLDIPKGVNIIRLESNYDHD